MRSDTDRLFDILDAIKRIERYSHVTQEGFKFDELIQTWMIHNLQIIGEAASRISVSLKKQNSSIPWDKIIGMRSILVHEYFGVDLNEVWNTVHKDIPNIKELLNDLISQISNR